MTPRIDRAAAIRAGDEFRERVRQANDPDTLADLMSEAIGMALAANGLSAIGRDGRAAVTICEIVAAHCMRDAMDAYRLARGLPEWTPDGLAATALGGVG